MNNKAVQATLTTIIYFFVYLLMVEWLRPVIELTDTAHLKIFCIFIAISFVFYLVKLDWKIAIPLKLIYILWIIVALYTELTFFSFEAVAYLVDMLKGNLLSLATQDWMAVNDPFRTLLFFCLLWMTAYLLNYWVRIRKNLFLFFLLTVLFITILDTFSAYRGDRSIIIVLVCGFVINGLLYAQKLMHEHKIQTHNKFFVSAVVSLVCLMAFSGVIAYALPKAGPTWPDPVPFFKASKPSVGASNGIGSNVARKVGYGENDEALGGAFLSDDTPVFQVITPTKQYWKIETKDTYTSKGWIQSQTEPKITNYSAGIPIISDITPGKLEDQVIAKIGMNQEFNFAMQPYGITTIDSDNPGLSELITLSLNEANQKITTSFNGSENSLGNYVVTYSEPFYSLKALRGTTDESLNELTVEFDRYLQLPDTLPQRVRDLAFSITETDRSLYDKAKSIERYFSRNSFRYDQKLAAIPKGDTDYVDQFLFETKIGYCDNFSTSMVVMLRSLGVPARWVKGFTSGDIVDRINDMPVYEVTNNNAHSWVEAYFPGIGWMNFEPTIGFSNSANLNYDIDLASDENDMPLTPTKPKPTPDKPEKEKTEVSKGFTEILADSLKWISDHKVKIIWSIIGLLVVSLLAYQFRRKWISKVLIPMYRMRKNDWDTFEDMYHQLLKQLKQYGLGKEQGQTLSNYAQQMDDYFGYNHMKKLTSIYEKGFYGNNRKISNYDSMRESWEYLINQLSS